MIHNKSAADYAKARQNGHYRNVCALYAAGISGLVMGRKKPDTSLLNKLENQDNIFPWIGELL
jgi:1,4-alpha-glucan branching enzyme